MRKQLLQSLVSVCITCATATFAASPVPEISFSDDHAKTAKDIVRRLSDVHYNKLTFDDTLSSRYLDHLFEVLDPNKFYFLQTDIDRWEPHRYQFDDTIPKGELETPKAILELYLLRATARLEQAIEQLESESFAFDFTRDEAIDFSEEERLWANSAPSLDEFWRKRLKYNVLNLMLGGDSETEARLALTKRYRNQLQRLGQQSSEEIFEIAMNALTELYDPHTSYMAPRTHESFNISMSLSLEGIGAVLQMDDNHTKVVRLIKAGPADKSGELKPADKIIAVGQGIDGEMVDVVGWRLDDVVDLIRGPKDSQVKLRIIPSDSMDSSNYKTIKITRNKVKLEEQSAQKAVIDLIDDAGELHKIGIIHIPTFYVDFEAYRRKDPNFKSTTRDVFRLLKELSQENIEGLVIDLRDNGGGSLQEAATLTDLFIDQGPVVQIRQSSNRILRNYNSRLPAAYKGPLVVLTNRLSASASEIFAGAIQDYKRGLIVGSQSFGKGTVQSLIGLHKGQLKVTESKFYRVSGDSTQHRGVVPDIQYPTLIDTTEVGESSYDNALPWDQIHAVNHRSYYNFDAVVESLTLRHNARKQDDPDFTYLIRQSERLQEAKDDKIVSLNRSIRESEKLRLEREALASENTRRTDKGLETFETIELWREDSKKAKKEKQGLYLDTSISVEDDPLLNEAGYILVDWLNLNRQKRIAKTLTSQPN